MTRIAVIDRSPVFARGLSRLLVDAGFTTVITGRSMDKELLWRSSILIADQQILDRDSFVHVLPQMPWLSILVITDTIDRPWPSGIATVSRSISAGDIRSVVTKIAKHINEPQGGYDSTPSKVREDQGANLSPRELDVLHRIARGMTHAQIARRLGISQHTVDTYVKRIRLKLGAGNKAELTRISYSWQHLDRPATSKEGQA